MSKCCSTANIAITETQTTTVEVVEVFYVYHRTVTEEVNVNEKLTVYPCPQHQFKPQSDAERLYNILQCGKIDEGAICDLIVKKSSPQRLHIVLEYHKLYNVNLVEILEKKLSGDFKTLVLALLSKPSEYYAAEVRRALKGLGIIKGFGQDKKSLIEILRIALNYQIELIKISYEKLYCTKLEDDVCAYTSGNFQKLLLALLQGKRSEAEIIVVSEVEKDVSDLIAAGICPSPDSSRIDAVLQIFSCRSEAHLCEVLKKFTEIAQCHVQVVIEKLFVDDVKDALLAIIQIVENRSRFFAERIHDAVAGWGTKDHQLIRVIVTRCEVDLKEIKEEYQKLYGKCLEDDIADDTSGWYRKTLLCLVQDHIDA